MPRCLATAALAAGVALAGVGGSPAADAGPGTIAFTRGEGEVGLPALYAIGADGTHTRRLAAEFAETPAWSPDGARVVYTAPFQDGFGLHALAPGQKPRLLAPRGADGDDCEAKACTYSNPVWSPDGKLVACSYGADLGNRDVSATIAVVPAEGGRTVFLTKGPADQDPSWSPASNALAFAANDGIRIVGINGGRSRLVAKGDGLAQPAWSRTWRIAFAGRGVEVVNANGSGRRVLARVAGVERPVWSPNGKLLVFETQMRSGFAGPLYVVRADGSGLHRLTPRGRSGGHPTWSPDSRLIAYVADPSSGGGGGLVVANPDGSRTRRLTRSETDDEPAWQPAPTRR